MSVSSLAVAKPPLKPFPSQFDDDSVRESDKLLDLCAKTLIDVEGTILAVNSLISTIYQTLDPPLFGESEACEFDLPFSETLAADSPRIVSDFDDSIVPETVFDDPMEDYVADSEDEGAEEATVTAEKTAVTEESSSPDMDYM